MQTVTRAPGGDELALAIAGIADLPEPAALPGEDRLFIHAGPSDERLFIHEGPSDDRFFIHGGPTPRTADRLLVHSGPVGSPTA